MTTPGGIFDRVADSYDNVGVAWFRPIAQWLVDELAPQPGERALDVGCGRGAALLPIAAAVGPTGRVLGVDLSPRMVERTAADTAGLPHVDVRVADASHLDLPPASQDVVASSLVLFFLADPAAALASWVALLVPGGRLGITTFAGQDPGWQGIDELFLPYLPPKLLDARTSGRQGPFASDQGVEGLLAGAGLVGVRTVRKTLSVGFADVDQWFAFSMSHGQRAMWDAVPEATRPEVRRKAEAVLLDCRDAAGRIGLTQDVRITLGSAPA